MNKEEYIGIIFIGFKFKTQRRKDGSLLFSYNEESMKHFEGKQLKIEEYSNNIDSFVIKQNGVRWHYPSDMVIEQLSNIKEEDIIKNLNKLFKKIKKNN